MKLVMTLKVRDEEDVLEASLRYLARSAAWPRRAD